MDTNKPSDGSNEHEGTKYYFCGPGCRFSCSSGTEGDFSGEKKVRTQWTPLFLTGWVRVLLTDE